MFVALHHLLISFGYIDDRIATDAAYVALQCQICTIFCLGAVKQVFIEVDVDLFGKLDRPTTV